MSKKWQKSQKYEEEYLDAGVGQWGIPFSEVYWLRFMEIDRVPESALEVGCGNFGLWRFNHRVTGIDPLDFSSLGTNFVKGRGEELPFDDNEFPDVYCVNALDHTEDPAQCMKEMARVAERRVVVWCYAFDPLARPMLRLAYRPHPHCFTKAELWNLVPSTLKVQRSSDVSPVGMFLKYARSPAAKMKIRVAELLGARALLLHLVKP